MPKLIFIVKVIYLVTISISSPNSLSAQILKKDNKIVLIKNADYDTIYCGRIVVNASFPGGVAAWTKYIADSIRYPRRDIQIVPQICVNLRFVILKTGAIEYTEAIGGIKNDFTNEAIRLLKASPRWIPATQNGRFVSESKLQTIIFSHTNPTKPIASACGDAFAAAIPSL